MNSKICVLYNDGKADCPMLVTNTNPIMIRTNAKDLSYWAQFIYHLSHEMTHYVVRQYKTDKAAIIKWFEETICEELVFVTSSYLDIYRFPLAISKRLFDYIISYKTNIWIPHQVKRR